MRKLELALYAEGTTDQLFLPSVIRRTSVQLLAQHKQSDVNVSPVEPIMIDSRGLKRDECIVRAAQQAIKYQALIVHSDADGPSAERALRERIQPGFERIQREEKVCKSLLPIIPVQAIEAWMLADHEVLRVEIGTDLTAHDLGIPEKARQVEFIAKPKQRLDEIVRKALANRSRRHRQTNLHDLYEPLGRRIRLERLDQVDSYVRFKEQLIATLKALKLIQ